MIQHKCKNCLFLILIHLFSWNLCAQPSFQLIGNSSSISQVVNPQGELIGIYKAPLLQFQVNKKWYSLLQLPVQMIIETKEKPAENNYYLKEIIFRNVSRDTLLLENIVPLGADQAEAVISSGGDNLTGKSKLYLLARTPVTCILPQGFDEIGFTAKRIFPNQGICALACRKPLSAFKTQVNRFSDKIEPGGSITYHLYIEYYQGKWQDAMDTVFGKRQIYQSLLFKGKYNNRNFPHWIKNSFLMQVFDPWNNKNFNQTIEKSNYFEEIKNARNYYGGADIVMLKPEKIVGSKIEKVQFADYNKKEGEFKYVNNWVTHLHSIGAKVLLLWSMATDTFSMNAMQKEQGRNLFALTKADGLISEIASKKTDIINPYVDFTINKKLTILNQKSEIQTHVLSVRKLEESDSTREVYLDMNKVILPWLPNYLSLKTQSDAAIDDVNLAFFNGIGLQINLDQKFDTPTRKIFSQYLGRVMKISRENAKNFNEAKFRPFIQTQTDSIYINKWEIPDKTIYTVFNKKPDGFLGKLFAVDSISGWHYIDLWKHREIIPSRDGKKYYLSLSIDSLFTASINSSISCIAHLPVLLSCKLVNNTIEITGKGEELCIWAGDPSYGNKCLRVKAGEITIDLSEKFPKYQGKYVIQLFNNGSLKDECIIE